ncbi:hypothetical protein BG004_000095 [Podila humilis]|nr:hypothetical protein BG004_000095 [Podila humilis]
MNRNNENKYPTEDNPFIGDPASAIGTKNRNDASGHVDPQQPQQPGAKAMRDGYSQGERAFEVAGPTMGGTPYYSSSLTNKMASAKISGGTPKTTDTTTSTIEPVGPSLVPNATASSALTCAIVGAGATESSMLNKTKNLTHDGNSTTSVESPHPHPFAVTPGANAKNKNILNPASSNAGASIPTATFVPPGHSGITATTPANATNHTSQATSTMHTEPIHSTGLNNPAAHSQNQHASSSSQPIAKGEVATAAVMGAASATIAAPPVHDTTTATNETPAMPTSSSRSTSYPTTDTEVPGNKDAKTAATATATTASPTTGDKNVYDHHSSFKDKVRNVFHRRSSTQDEATSAEVAAAGASKETEASYDPKLDRFEAIPETPYTSSGALKADLHAAPGKPATKIDAQPTKVLNQGQNTKPPSPPMMDKSADTSTSARTSEKKNTNAPAVGVASATGATATAGTSALLRDHSRGAKASVDDTPYDNNNNNNNNKAHTPTTTSNTTYATPSRDTSSYKSNVPLAGTATSVPVMNNSTSIHSNKPLTEKITAPVVGAAAAGTAAHMVNKEKDAKKDGADTTARDSMKYPSSSTYSTTANPVRSPHGAINPAASSPTMNSYNNNYNNNSMPYNSSSTTAARNYDPISATSTKNNHNTGSGYKSTATATATPNPTPTTHPRSGGNAAAAHIQSADNTAKVATAAVPASYKGPVPKPGVGEEVVWAGE